MSLFRKTSGLIFEDCFDAGLESRWLCSPAACVTVETGGLALQHSSAGQTMALFNIPPEDFVMEVLADYTPSLKGDEGGIVVWRDSYHKLEYLESLDTTTTEYSRWRAERRGLEWNFYADRGYGWEYHDSAMLDATKAGIGLINQPSTGYVPLVVKRVTVCSSDSVKISNLDSGFMVYLCDKEGFSVGSAVVPEHWSGVEIKLPSLSFEGMLKVYNEAGELISSIGPLFIYGGDVFVYGTDLQVIWRGQALSETEFTYLGVMYDRQILVQMELKNPSKVLDAFNVTLKVAQYLEKFGYQWVDVAEDIGGIPGDFSDVLTIDRLGPLESKPFWLKVEKLYEVFSFEPARFLLDITHV